MPRSERRFIITGATASGKGIQGAKLAERFGFVHISTGDLIRAEVSCHNPLRTKQAEISR